MESKIYERLAQIKKAYHHQYTESPLPGSLYSGDAGAFLFRLYYQRLLDETDENLEEGLVEFITEQLQQPIGWTTFCNGTSGFAWFMLHLKNEGFVDLGEDLFHDFDEVVFDSGLAYFNDENHDFMHGALGNMVYLVDRCTTAQDAEKYVTPMLKRLREQADETEDWLFWRETEVMLDKDEEGKNIVNYHLSHGQASKIVVLARAAQLGVSMAVEMLQKAVRFLMDHKNENTEKAVVPSRTVDGVQEDYAHLGWCRGNISIALALVQAAKALNDDDLMQEAIGMGLHTLQHDTTKKARITDFAFCHGTAGLSHLYGRLYVETNNNAFLQASESWMEKTLNNANFDDGIAGFKTWNNPTREWINDFSLLSGVSGTGLSMVAHVSKENMNWDACFLLS